MRLEESEYEHDLKRKAVEYEEDPRQPLRMFVAAMLLEAEGEFEAIDTQGLHRKVRVIAQPHLV
jgi:hypothetical protein